MPSLQKLHEVNTMAKHFHRLKKHADEQASKLNNRGLHATVQKIKIGYMVYSY